MEGRPAGTTRAFTGSRASTLWWRAKTPNSRVLMSRPASSGPSSGAVPSETNRHAPVASATTKIIAPPMT